MQCSESAKPVKVVWHIIRQLQKSGTESWQIQSFYRLRGGKKREEYKFRCAMGLARCYVCA